MPEFTAPGLGRASNTIHIELEMPENSSGVLYALGGAGGGVTLYLDQGKLVYLYNMMLIEQYEVRSPQTLTPGKHTIDVVTLIDGPGKSGTVNLRVDNTVVATGELKRTVPAAFSASETFDVGADLGSTVTPAYYDVRPFEFEGRILKFSVDMNQATSRKMNRP